MSDMDKLRMLRRSALEARRQHISHALGTGRPPASTGRLSGLQRMIARVEQALGQRPAERREKPRTA
ncbi:hypothetical protein [Pseudoroseomonas cervicalis]|uniref:hypothetical protein n=1 Tax=Teichococcus cervicalis TaxID=204525 RepID=UPI0022F1A389|nr:hypothetical protein [Pseudoroseomonas cervicalis]WBV45035.1 hypothetical protein PFY06_18190 [Pseudoroseomonas cervicalis]